MNELSAFCPILLAKHLESQAFFPHLYCRDLYVRLGAQSICPHLYWRDLYVRSGWVCIDEKIVIPNFLRETLIYDLHVSHPGTSEWYVWLHIDGGYKWIGKS